MRITLTNVLVDDLGTVVAAVFDDTCGNLIQIVTPAPSP